MKRLSPIGGAMLACRAAYAGRYGEALRLRSEGFSARKIAQSLSLGRATISDYIRRSDVEGLSWPLPNTLSDTALEQLLYPRAAGDVRGSFPQPDWSYMHTELRRKGVTLSLLWEEYRGFHPDGYGYSRYCELYTRWEGKLSPVMRQRHPAGERLFVDYAGQTIDVVCPKTGEVSTVQIFIATLGASNYTYVEGYCQLNLRSRNICFKGKVFTTLSY